MADLRRSLLFRLTIPCLITVFTLGAAYTNFWSAKYEAEVEARFVTGGQGSAMLFSDAAAEALWQFDANSVNRILSGFTNQEGFEEAVVLDSAGVFARYAVSDQDSLITPGVLEQLSGRTLWRDEEHVYFSSAVTHPRHGQLGQLVTVFSLAPMKAMKSSARREANLVAAVAFGLLGALLFFVARSVILPLARITDVVEKVAEGDTSLAIPNGNRSDEVGRLARALEVFRNNATHLIEAQTEANLNRRVAELALIDDLTGLSNRRAVEAWFAQLDARHTEGGHPPHVLFHIDLDGFKQINDTLGHDAGDHVIRCVAERMMMFYDQCEMIARIGGDEFLMAIEQKTQGPPPLEFAEQVFSKISEPIGRDGQILRFGASIGVAINLSDGERMAETLINADIALYRAKSQGKGRIVQFTSAHRAEIAKKKQLSDDIICSLDSERFIPFFHPIVDAVTHEIVSLEVLARWQHPTRGVLPPASFIPVATELNLMRHIDRQVLEKAFDLYAHLEPAGGVKPGLSINVSTSRLIEPDFLDSLRMALDRGLAVNVELLETMYVDELPDQVEWQMDRLRDMGVKLHIDDFGTGHSSIAGLLKIRPDTLKIDKQFILPALCDTRAQDLVQIIIGIADLLGIQVTAEGVETFEHAALMRRLGAHRLQGYFFARPMAFDDLHDYLFHKDSGAKQIREAR